MAKQAWWKYLLFFVRWGAKQVEDGNIGAGKKTAQGGKIAGEAIDAVMDATSSEEEKKE
jgi:hypothetical protein